MKPESLKMSQELYDEFEHMASLGLTHQQMAACKGICRSTLQKYKCNYPEFAEAIERGKARGVRDVSNALYNSAVGGDVTAQRYFLNNRSRDQWSERHVNENVNVEMTHEEWLDKLK